MGVGHPEGVSHSNRVLRVSGLLGTGSHAVAAGLVSQGLLAAAGRQRAVFQKSRLDELRRAKPEAAWCERG